MQSDASNLDISISSLTPRESELLRKAGERVFALSRRLAARENEAEQLRSETKSLRDLLAESREVRQVLSAQVNSMQTIIDREYDERAELRRLLASLQIQVQELLPVVTGLSRLNLAPPAQAALEAPREPSERAARDRRKPKSFSQRLISAARTELQGIKKTKRR